MQQNEFIEEAKDLMYGPGVVDSVTLLITVTCLLIDFFLIENFNARFLENMFLKFAGRIAKNC